ncbi:hypothetical protein [Flavobacterium nitratireducens]|uniref:hypothetical protein n=1 Tax=Flavobacterium nitratireducens TaxID=992289 RepID=UPI0024153448|nr:hypothetical protein [Flavobacterium nitratireducens]
MKKKLEADLISIAHRILQLKDKSDVNQLYLETQKLYEKLSVLKFIEENYGEVKPTIGNYSEIEKEIEEFYDKEATLPVETVIEMTESNIFPETKTEEAVAAIVEEKEAEIVSPVEETIQEEPIAEAEVEETEVEEEDLISDEEEAIEENEIEFNEEEAVIEEETEEEEEVEVPSFKAAFELTEAPEIEETKRPEPLQISFEDLLGLDYSEPEFVKVDDVPAEVTKEIVFEAAEPIENKEEKTEIIEETPIEKAVETAEKPSAKTVTLNDKFSKGIEIDLNDRIAFVKHLFGNSNEDYIRVMNQIITFDNYYETKSFIDDMVKPDYNNWEGKEEYEERFMEIIEKKFL